MSIPIWPRKDENPFGEDAPLPDVEAPSDTESSFEIEGCSQSNGDDAILQQHDGDEPNFDKPLREEDVLPGPAITRLQAGVREAEFKQMAEEYENEEWKRLHKSCEDSLARGQKQNRTAHGGGLREDTGKLRYDLIPVYPMARLAEVYTLGCTKYADRNWEKGIAYANCMAALKRHLEKWWAGENEDPEGHHHLASVMFWAAALMEYELHETVPDERPYHD